MKKIKPKKILLVDDDRGYRDIFSKKLKDAGYEVYEAWHGSEALQLIRKKRPDVLITDYEMPHMNGQELVNELHRRRYKFPIIVYTSKTNLDEDSFKYKNLQFHQKSGRHGFDTDGLIEKLSKL